MAGEQVLHFGNDYGGRHARKMNDLEVSGVHVDRDEEVRILKLADVHGYALERTIGKF